MCNEICGQLNLYRSSECLDIPGNRSEILGDGSQRVRRGRRLAAATAFAAGFGGLAAIGMAMPASAAPVDGNDRCVDEGNGDGWGVDPETNEGCLIPGADANELCYDEDGNGEGYNPALNESCVAPAVEPPVVPESPETIPPEEVATVPAAPTAPIWFGNSSSDGPQPQTIANERPAESTPGDAVANGLEDPLSPEFSQEYLFDMFDEGFVEGVPLDEPVAGVEPADAASVDAVDVAISESELPEAQDQEPSEPAAAEAWVDSGTPGQHVLLPEVREDLEAAKLRGDQAMIKGLEKLVADMEAKAAGTSPGAGKAQLSPEDPAKQQDLDDALEAVDRMEAAQRVGAAAAAQESSNMSTSTPAERLAKERSNLTNQLGSAREAEPVYRAAEVAAEELGDVESAKLYKEAADEAKKGAAQTLNTLYTIRQQEDGELPGAADADKVRQENELAEELNDHRNIEAAHTADVAVLEASLKSWNDRLEWAKKDEEVELQEEIEEIIDKRTAELAEVNGVTSAKPIAVDAVEGEVAVGASEAAEPTAGAVTPAKHDLGPVPTGYKAFSKPELVVDLQPAATTDPTLEGSAERTPVVPTGHGVLPAGNVLPGSGTSDSDKKAQPSATEIADATNAHRDIEAAHTANVAISVASVEGWNRLRDKAIEDGDVQWQKAAEAFLDIRTAELEEIYTGKPPTTSNEAKRLAVEKLVSASFSSGAEENLKDRPTVGTGESSGTTDADKTRQAERIEKELNDHRDIEAAHTAKEKEKKEQSERDSNSGGSGTTDSNSERDQRSSSFNSEDVNNGRGNPHN